MTKQQLLLGIAAMLMLIILSWRQLQDATAWRSWTWATLTLAVIALVVMATRWRRAS